MPMKRRFAGIFPIFIILLMNKASTALDSRFSHDIYDIGSPVLSDLWVNPVTGQDTNSGLSLQSPLKTLTAAWNKLPVATTTTGYRINLLPGTYPCEPGEPDNCQNNFGNRTGTYLFPIILRAYSGSGTVTVRGGLDLFNVSYLYMMDLTLSGGGSLPTNASGNNLLHLANVNHVLLRSMTLTGPDCANDSCNNLQEVLKTNQAQYLYVESSTMSGAWHSVVDYFAVQYGHFVYNQVHTAGQWCMYVKGGTSYLRVEGNELHHCQLGFSAGQSANFAMMQQPWLHYDAYDIKLVNNIFHNLNGVAVNVAGGYNILFAYNTAYRIGTSVEPGYPLLTAARAERGCNATDELPSPVPTCEALIAQGGWGPNYLTANLEAIPNRNVYFYNNLFYNPAPAKTLYTHFDILNPIPRPFGFQNMPDPITTDHHLVIAGNLIWNGDTTMPLGIEGSQACTNTNPTCHEAQIRANNTINSVEPQLVNPASRDFRLSGNWYASVTTYAIPDFVWDIATVPSGETRNSVPIDFSGVNRVAIDPPGAYHPAESSDDVVQLHHTSPSIVGAGAGDDTYILGPNTLSSTTNLTLSDTQGSNRLQLLAGLSIAKSEVAATALRLTLDNGAKVTILGADAFQYDVGGNGTLAAYAAFAQNTLKVVVPPTGIAMGGPVTITAP
ncbi:exported hypothetical protein [Gammaproteobacteria bacterium]